MASKTDCTRMKVSIKDHMTWELEFSESTLVDLDNLSGLGASELILWFSLAPQKM